MTIGYFNTYKDVTGTIEYDAVTDMHYGELINIDKDQAISYEADNLLELEHLFRCAVDYYLDSCNSRNVKP